MASKTEKLRAFLAEQIAQADFRAEAYVLDETKKRRPQRNIYVKIKKYLNDFLLGQKANRWITLTGLRGAGKTTILSQVFNETKNKDLYRLFLSLDHTSQVIGITLNEIITTFEEIIGKSIETLDKPLILFLDEVQYDPQWGITLKTIFDRSNNVFIFSTGSAALQMNINPDIARRTIFEKLFPLNFAEYLKIKMNKFEIKGLSKEVRSALFSSSNAAEAYNKIKILDSKINQYYLGVNRYEFTKYLNYGTLPFMVASNNEAIVYDQINKTLERVIRGDIASTSSFNSDTISKISAILYAVADMDAFSFQTIAKNFELSRSTVAEIFNTLVNTEILQRIYPYGSHLNQVSEIKKPSKFLFTSPAFRSMYYKLIGNIISEQNAKGKLLEDLVGMYLYRLFHKNPGYSITYDSAEGGADFIVTSGSQKIIIEVGAGEKDYKQIARTDKKVKSSYNLVISEENQSIEYNEHLNAMKIPLRIFLLT